MKSVIIYYSYSGNTRAVASVLAGDLQRNGSVDTVELKSLDEPRSFLGQCHRAFKHAQAKLETVNVDLSGYDIICIGTPVWAFGPAPAINAYLAQCKGLDNKKKIVLFTTYGSGTGNAGCLAFMKQALIKKGASEFREFSVQQGKVRDSAFVLAKIQEASGI